MNTADTIRFNAHEAKLNFSALINHLANGKEVIITRSGRDFARINPIRETPNKRLAGRDQNSAWIADNFNDPLPRELQKFFE